MNSFDNEDITSFFASLENIIKFCNKYNMGDPFSYNRMREIVMSLKLEHKVATTYSNEDASDKENELCEYKSTIDKNIKGTYNGISYYPTLEEQLYKTKEKIFKCKKHYFARFNKYINIVELYTMKCEDIWLILEPKIKVSWKNSPNRKDPRVGAIIYKKEIYKYGTKIPV